MTINEAIEICKLYKETFISDYSEHKYNFLITSLEHGYIDAKSIETYGMIYHNHNQKSFLKPFRIGKSTNRAILDKLGREFLVVPKGREKYVTVIVNALNNM